jgi:hypothetical protein
MAVSEASVKYIIHTYITYANAIQFYRRVELEEAIFRRRLLCEHDISLAFGLDSGG